MKNERKPLISVIVPVYKVEAYLDRCVESILSQTIQAFELVLVDDGSPDHSGELCDRWGEIDSRIRVVHKENGGLSDARNAGVAVARGEWITFIDSDDYIHPKMLEALYGAAQSAGVKVSSCGFANTTGEPLPADQELPVRVITAENYYISRYVNATIACAKLYHKSVVLPYPKGKLHEDEYVTYKILFGQEKLAVVDGELYAYFQNEQSITRADWNPRRLDALQAFEEQVDFFTEQGYSRIAKTRANEHIGNICRQMRYVSRLSDKSEKLKYRRFCTGKLREAIQKYQKLGYIDPVEHHWAYKVAWPWKKVWFELQRRVGNVKNE